MCVAYVEGGGSRDRGGREEMELGFAEIAGRKALAQSTRSFRGGLTEGEVAVGGAVGQRRWVERLVRLSHWMQKLGLAAGWQKMVGVDFSGCPALASVCSAGGRRWTTTATDFFQFLS